MSVVCEFRSDLINGRFCERMTRLLTIFATFLLAGMAFGGDLYLLPEPASVKLNGGTFKVPQQIKIRTSSQGAKILRAVLVDQNENRISAQVTSAQGWVALIGDVPPPACPDEPESYRLDVTPKGIALIAPTADGYRHGIRTLGQLLSSSTRTTLRQKSGQEGVSVAEISRPTTGAIPCCTIEDHPAMGVRGLMIDMVRLKEKDETYFRLLEEIASWKMNALFLHFTDHQGCSIELKSHPELVTAHAMSQSTLRRLIARGQDLGVRVIPEIEAWGHAKWITNKYPSLCEPGCTSLCLANENIYPLLEDIIKEVSSLFPDDWIHLGCDEAAYGRDQSCQSKMEEIGADRMIADHINRLSRICEKYGKRAVIWGDVVLREKRICELLDKNIIIEDWSYGREVTSDHLKQIKSIGLRALAAPALIYGGCRVAPSNDNYLNVANFTRLAFQAKADGIVATVWYPQRYVPGSLGPGIAVTAAQAWNPGGQDQKSVMAAYLVQRFGLDPTPERLDAMMKLGSAGQRQGSLEAGIWSDKQQLLSHTTPEGITADDLYIASVRGLGRLSGDLSSVKINKESFESLVLVADIAEHLANRRLVAREVSRLIAEAKSNLRAGDYAATKSKLLEAAKAIDVMENERMRIWNQMIRVWDHDRYVDSELRNGNGDENNLYWWFANTNTNTVGYAAQLAKSLQDAGGTTEAARIFLEDW